MADAGLDIAVDLFDPLAQLVDLVDELLDPPGQLAHLLFEAVHPNFAAGGAAWVAAHHRRRRAAIDLALQHVEVALEAVEPLQRQAVLAARRRGWSDNGEA